MSKLWRILFLLFVVGAVAALNIGCKHLSPADKAAEPRLIERMPAHQIPENSEESGTVHLRMLNGGQCSAAHLGNNVYATAVHCLDAAPNRLGVEFIEVNGQTSPIKIYAMNVTTGYDGIAIFSAPWVDNKRIKTVKLAERITETGDIRCYPIMRTGHVAKPQYFTKHVNKIILNPVESIVNILGVVSGGCSGGALFNEDGDLMGVTLHGYYYADIGGFANTLYEKSKLQEAIENATEQNSKSLNGEAIREILRKIDLYKRSFPDYSTYRPKEPAS